MCGRKIRKSRAVELAGEIQSVFLRAEKVFLYHKMIQVNLDVSSARYAFGYPGQNAVLVREKSLKPFGNNIGVPLFGAHFRK